MADEQFSSNAERDLVLALVGKIRNHTIAEVYNRMRGKKVTVRTLEAAFGMDKGQLSRLAKEARQIK